MRYVLALIVILAGTAGGALVYRNLTAGPPVVLPAPSHLQVTASGTPLLPGGLTNISKLDFKVGEGSTVAGIDLEVRPTDEPFSNAPTASANDLGQIAAACKRCTAGGSVIAHLQLPDGVYHWQVRLHNGQGVSPWMAYRGAVKIDTGAPVMQYVASSTDPNPRKVYHDSTIRFTWYGTDADTGDSGLAGYSYRLDTDPHGQARPDIRTGNNNIVLRGFPTGQYYFHVRAEDGAGNWGPQKTFPVKIDATPPGLAHIQFSRFQFDPLYDSLRTDFAVNRPAKTVRVGIYDHNTHALVRLVKLSNLPKNQNMTVWWNGKDSAGHFAPAGSYDIYIRAIDQYGHASLSGWQDFVIDYKRIVVSLSQQKLWAYDGNHLFLTSLVTTGNKALPTPTGTYHILGKFHPFTFHSPWPKSSPYYYKPSKTEWAMLFKEGGYFIHDAPWRTAFGPGTNAQTGTPGTNYTGTHGCVNVPADVAQELFAWAQDGTVVQVNA